MKKFCLYVSLIFLLICCVGFGGLIILSLILASDLLRSDIMFLLGGNVILMGIILLNIKSIKKYVLIINNNYQYNILTRRDWILIFITNFLSCITYCSTILT